MDRLAMLRQLAAQRPDEPFVQYGLAMELSKQADKAEARATFERLMREHPSYLPAYLMAGNLMAEMGDPQSAKATYDVGIEHASAASDEHTQGELETARSELG